VKRYNVTPWADGKERQTQEVPVFIAKPELGYATKVIESTAPVFDLDEVERTTLSERLEEWLPALTIQRGSRLKIPMQLSTDILDSDWRTQRTKLGDPTRFLVCTARLITEDQSDESPLTRTDR
jgi:hypothetical protein